LLEAERPVERQATAAAADQVQHQRGPREVRRPRMQIDKDLEDGGRRAQQWRQQTRSAIERCANLDVLAVPTATTTQLVALATRSMFFVCTIQAGHVWLADATASVDYSVQQWCPDPAD